MDKWGSKRKIYIKRTLNAIQSCRIYEKKEEYEEQNSIKIVEDTDCCRTLNLRSMFFFVFIVCSLWLDGFGLFKPLSINLATRPGNAAKAHGPSL